MAGKKKTKSKSSKASAAKSAAPKLRVALYNLDDGTPKGDAVRGIMGQLNIPVVNITQEWMGTPVGAIAGMPGFKLAKIPFDGEVPAEEFMLMAGFSNEKMNELLAAMRAADCSVGCKAMVTPHNRLWPLGMLIREVCKEHHAMNPDPVPFEEIMTQLK